MFNFSTSHLWQGIQKGLLCLLFTTQIAASSLLVGQRSEPNVLLHCSLVMDSSKDFRVFLSKEDLLASKEWVQRCTQKMFSFFVEKSFSKEQDPKSAEDCFRLPLISQQIMAFLWNWTYSAMAVSLLKKEFLLLPIAAVQVNCFCKNSWTEISLKGSGDRHDQMLPTEQMKKRIELSKGFEGFSKKKMYKSTIASPRRFTIVDFTYEQVKCSLNVNSWFKHILFLVATKFWYEFSNHSSSSKRVFNFMDVDDLYTSFIVRGFTKNKKKGSIKSVYQSRSLLFSNKFKLREIFEDHQASQKDGGGYVTISERHDYIWDLEESKSLFMASLSKADQGEKYLLGSKFDRYLSFVGRSRVADVNLENMEDVD